MSSTPETVDTAEESHTARADEFVTADGFEIHYSAWGDADAPPVVCVHGLSRTGRDFDPFASRLASEYRLLCPDMPGRGLTEWADDPERYTGTAMADLLVSFCDELGLDSFRWVGISMGGTLGMALAGGPLRDRITHLVLDDVGPAPAEDESAREGIERIVEYLTNPPTFDRLTDLESYYRENYATFSEMTDAEWRSLTVTSARRTENGKFTPAYDPRVVEPLLIEEPETDPWKTWDAIDAPTFVLRGENSDILSAATLDEMVEHRPETGVLEVPDCGHAPVLNVPEQVEPVRDFFIK